MKIIQYYEYQGVRLELTIESKDLLTHSRMNDLSPEIQDKIKYQLYLAATYTQLQLNGQVKKWLIG